MKTDFSNLDPENTCFVISPIGEKDTETRNRSDRVFRHIIEPAAQQNNLVAIRSDQITTPGGMITQQVIQHIMEDRIVVADLTDHNANVFYELALRHAFRKPVVQLIQSTQKIPFDVHGTRTVQYLLDLDNAHEAKQEVTDQITTALATDFDVQSPVTIAASLAELAKNSPPAGQVLLRTILDQIEQLNNTISDLSELVFKPEDLKDAIPPKISDSIEDILRKYAEEIDLIKSVRYAGINGIMKRRANALKAFGRAIDEETQGITVIGSSLKGLLQKDEYKEIAEKLRFKTDRGLVPVKFLLTHPIVADFRAKQENRALTEIGMEILLTLENLKDWNRKYCEVRLYLGTPTCFGIKTTNKMLINPYPYQSVSFDSPCLLLSYSDEGGIERPGYFFDEFNSRHFGAWDTDLAVQITDYDRAISYFRSQLSDYASNVEKLLTLGKKTG